MTGATTQVFVEPCAVLVGLRPDHQALCQKVLANANLRVHAFDDASAATASIPKLMPRLVVVPATLPQDSLESTDDAAVAVGAPLLLLFGDESAATLQRRLAEAVKGVEARFDRRP
jgi:hypothetical protein